MNWGDLVQWTEADVQDDPEHPGVRLIENDDTRRLDRAFLAAETSAMAGGALLPEARGYNLPPLVHGLEIVQMDKSAWEEMKAAANWLSYVSQDAVINLDHPDVKAAFEA